MLKEPFIKMTVTIDVKLLRDQPVSEKAIQGIKKSEFLR